MLMNDYKSDNLIIMTRTMTATAVSRNFSDVLDLVESGETVLITRGKKTIAKFEPAQSRTSGEMLSDLLSATGVPGKDPKVNSIWKSVIADRDSEDQNRDRY